MMDNYIFQDLNVESHGYLSSFICTVLKRKIKGIISNGYIVMGVMGSGCGNELVLK